jgi:DNA-binding beta-propeller fold protein YncE
MAFSADEKVLLVSHTTRITFIDVDKAKSGGDAILGYIDGSRFAVSWGMAITPDGKYAFAAQQRTALLAMIDVEKARSSGFDQSSVVSVIPTSPSPISVAVSADGKYVYVANRIAPDVLADVPPCKGGIRAEGVVQIIDVERARTDAAKATIGFASPAGCGPQNVAVSPDGKRMSVTAGGALGPSNVAAENAIVLFDPRPVGDGKAPVPLGRIPMPAPPLLVEDTGTRLIVGFFPVKLPPDETVNLAVIDPTRAASGKDAIIGRLPFWATFIALSADRRTLFAGRVGTLSIIDIDRALLMPMGN